MADYFATNRGLGPNRAVVSGPGGMSAINKNVPEAMKLPPEMLLPVLQAIAMAMQQQQQPRLPMMGASMTPNEMQLNLESLRKIMGPMR